MYSLTSLLFLLRHVVPGLPSLIGGRSNLATAVARFVLKQRTAQTQHSSSPPFSSSRLRSSCRLPVSYHGLKKKKCTCPSCHTRPQRPQKTSFHSLESLLKGNTMCSTSICASASSSLAPSDVHVSQKAKQEDSHCVVQGIPPSHLRYSPSLNGSPDRFQCRQGKLGGQVSHCFSVSFVLFTNTFF